MKLEEIKREAFFHREKLQKIKVCAFDVDGILTDGSLWWAGDEVGWNRAFNIRDGYGMKVLQGAGYKVGVITGGDSSVLEKRFKNKLKLDFVYEGSQDKRGAFLDLMGQGYRACEILYMGDEHFDIPLLKKAGFSATVPDACEEVKLASQYTTKTKGGCGAAREVIDILRWANGISPEVPDFEERENW